MVQQYDEVFEIDLAVAVDIAPVDAGARDIVLHPACATRVPPPRLTLEVVVPLDKEVVVRILRRPVGVPIPRIGKTGISVKQAGAPDKRVRGIVNRLRISRDRPVDRR